MRSTETPKPIWIKFCTVVDIPDIVTYINVGDHRLRGFWVAGGQISPSPIDFHRRPYNTLALPCERVIKACQLLVFMMCEFRSNDRFRTNTPNTCKHSRPIRNDYVIVEAPPRDPTATQVAKELTCSLLLEST